MAYYTSMLQPHNLSYSKTRVTYSHKAKKYPLKREFRRLAVLSEQAYISEYDTTILN